jgi:hypothetical protein
VSDRLSMARELLQQRTEVEPDFYFAKRVVARLPQPNSADLLGRAALRALPAALGLAAVLAAIGLRQIPPDALLLTEDTGSDSLLTYSVLVEGDAP